MAKKKAADSSGVVAEMLQHGGQGLLEFLSEIFNDVLMHEADPKSWKETKLKMLHKKGDAKSFENYRPISLLNSMCKIFASIILSRIEEKVDKHLQKTQYGFRKRRGTAQAIHCIRRIAEHGEQTMTKTLVL